MDKKSVFFLVLNLAVVFLSVCWLSPTLASSIEKDYFVNARLYMVPSHVAWGMVHGVGIVASFLIFEGLYYNLEKDAAKKVLAFVLSVLTATIGVLIGGAFISWVTGLKDAHVLLTRASGTALLMVWLVNLAFIRLTIELDIWLDKKIAERQEPQELR